MTIIEKDALLLRVVVGECSDDDGNSYEMTTSTDMTPLIKSHQTGRTFHLSWQDIMELAIEAGIDKEPTNEVSDNSN